MVLRANEKVTRGVGESAKAADRFASCREERMGEGDAFPLERGLAEGEGGASIAIVEIFEDEREVSFWRAFGGRRREIFRE